LDRIAVGEGESQGINSLEKRGQYDRQNQYTLSKTTRQFPVSIQAASHSVTTGGTA
jgi:hypothetical protein